MNTINHKQRVKPLLVVCFLLLILCGWLFWELGLQTVHIALASEQTVIFEEMRIKALQCEPAGAVAFLEYAVDYYPSGTKQKSGSRLDRMVEQSRSATTREIISYLRSKTGQDLGEDPQVWIQKYKAK